MSMEVIFRGPSVDKINFLFLCLIMAAAAAAAAAATTVHNRHCRQCSPAPDWPIPSSWRCKPYLTLFPCCRFTSRSTSCRLPWRGGFVHHLNPEIWNTSCTMFTVRIQRSQFLLDDWNVTGVRFQSLSQGAQWCFAVEGRGGGKPARLANYSARWFGSRDFCFAMRHSLIDQNINARHSRARLRWKPEEKAVFFASNWKLLVCVIDMWNQFIRYYMFYHTSCVIPNSNVDPFTKAFNLLSYLITYSIKELGTRSLTFNFIFCFSNVQTSNQFKNSFAICFCFLFHNHYCANQNNRPY